MKHRVSKLESAAEHGLRQLREALVLSFNNRDVDTLLSHLDEDVVVTWQNAEVCRGREEVRDFYERMMSGDNRIVRDIQAAPEIEGRKVREGWAVTWGNMHDHFVLNDGSDLPFHSRFTATTEQRGDAWVVTAFHASVSVFENPVLRLAVSKSALWTGGICALSGIVLGGMLAWILGRDR